MENNRNFSKSNFPKIETILFKIVLEKPPSPPPITSKLSLKSLTPVSATKYLEINLASGGRGELAKNAQKAWFFQKFMNKIVAS